MLKTVNLGLQYGSRKLFDKVNIQFDKGNCYGIIGANGAGKSTFLKLLSGEIESTEGEVIKDPKERMSVLRQNQNAFDDQTVIKTVLLGHKRLVEIMNEKEVYYAKESLTDEEGCVFLTLRANLWNLMVGRLNQMRRHYLMVLVYLMNIIMS